MIEKPFLRSRQTGECSLLFSLIGHSSPLRLAELWGSVCLRGFGAAFFCVEIIRREKGVPWGLPKPENLGRVGRRNEMLDLKDVILPVLHLVLQRRSRSF